MDYIEAIGKVSEDGELWKLWYIAVPSPETAEAYVAAAIEM